MLVAGFFRPVASLPVWFRWLNYLSFAKYLYDGSVQVLFGGRIGEIDGDLIVANTTPVIPTGPGWNILALIAWAVFFRVLAFIGLKLSFRFAQK